MNNTDDKPDHLPKPRLRVIGDDRERRKEAAELAEKYGDGDGPYQAKGRAA